MTQQYDLREVFNNRLPMDKAYIPLNPESFDGGRYYKVLPDGRLFYMRAGKGKWRTVSKTAFKD